MKEKYPLENNDPEKILLSQQNATENGQPEEISPVKTFYIAQQTLNINDMIVLHLAKVHGNKTVCNTFLIRTYNVDIK